VKRGSRSPFAKEIKEKEMGKRKINAGCASVLGGIVISIVIILVAMALGGTTGAVVGVIVSVILFGAMNSKKDRICDICGSPILRVGYNGTINGKHFSNICAKCKNQVTSAKRKQALKDILEK